MADIAVNTAQMGVVFGDKAEIYDFVAAVTITPLQAVYEDTTGRLVLSDADAAGTAKFRGIALNGGGAGQGISVLKRGHIFGFTITGLAYRAQLFLSNTAGSLADAAGTVSVIVGTVTPLSDNAKTKVAYIDADWKTA